MSKKRQLFELGLKAFNDKKFYDAHEHWEELWLEFKNSIELFQEIDGKEILILDLVSIKEVVFKKIIEHKNKQYFMLLGFCEEVNGPLKNYYEDLGCDIILQRHDLATT